MPTNLEEALVDKAAYRFYQVLPNYSAMHINGMQLHPRQPRMP
jgi:hypothetical protein